MVYPVTVLQDSVSHEVVKADTAAAGHPVDIGATLIHHITNSHQIELPFIGIVNLPIFPEIHLWGMTIDLSPTKHVIMMWLAALLLILIFAVFLRPQIRPKGLYNFFEAIIEFIRTGILRPNFGEQTDKYAPFFLTLFFFILFMNLIGLVPYGAASTGNITVTAVLALFTFLVTQIVAIRSQGILGYLKHLTGATPWFLWPIMVPIEIIGLFTKPFALSVRLFANMTAGHVVIISLLGLIFVLNTLWVAPVSLLFTLAMFILELFVAFLQAYVFTLLSALFASMGFQHEKETEHDEKAKQA